MSALRLYSPVELQLFSGGDSDREAADCAGSETDLPVIPFPAQHRAGGRRAWDGSFEDVDAHLSLAVNFQTPLDRARLLHQHRCCPTCGRGGTVPREAVGMQAMCLSMPVPGTRALLGFGCHHCGNEWSV
jgi:hypothetical protein